jgi:hypothetical protein
MGDAMKIGTIVGLVALCLVNRAFGAEGSRPVSPDTVRWFQSTEQALMDSVAVGDKGPWERIMDPACVVTSEEGDVVPRQQFLDDLRPLPSGLTGSIAVKELTVDEFPGLAVVRYLADESEVVFDQRLATHGWTFTVELREGSLYGGRDSKKLRPLIPLTPDAFVVSGSLGEWLFVTEKGRAVRILDFRKFEPLVWTRVDDGPSKP